MKTILFTVVLSLLPSAGLRAAAVRYEDQALHQPAAILSDVA